MKRIAMIMALLMCIAGVHADICNIAGFIFDDKGAAPQGTQVSITNLEYGVTYRTVTGTGWPYSNYYLQTITCTAGKDKIEVSAERDNAYESITFIPDGRLVQINITLPAALSPVPDKDKASSAGGGGGGGSSGGGGYIPDMTVDTQKTDPYNLSAGTNMSIFTLDRWFNLERYVLTVKELGKDSIIVGLSSGEIELKIGDRKDVDINGDGITDYTIQLEDINGSIAYLRFYKAWNPILAEEGIGLAETKSTEETPVPVKPENPVLLFAMVIVLVILTIILIIKDRRGRR